MCAIDGVPHSPLTLAAAACGDIKTMHHGLPNNIAFHSFPALRAAMRAVLRAMEPHPFIHACRDKTARLPAGAAARAASRPLRVGFGLPRE